MKTKIAMLVAVAFSLGMMSCNTDYKKTNTGLLYKIFPGNSKDSVAKPNNVVKFNIIQKLNDSVLFTSHGKAPIYIPLTFAKGADYSPWDVLFDMKAGDSAVVVEFYDTLLKKGIAQNMPFAAKKGDRINNYIRVLEVFRSDSIARIDYAREMEKDKPRQEKERAEMLAKQKQQQEEAEKKEFEALKKSGQWEAQQKVVEDFLKARNITSIKTDIGTHIVIKQKGSGEPVTTGKYLTIKYTGKTLPEDSVFESSSLVYQIGVQSFIRGWEEGMYQFNSGGSGTIYMPGYLAYGKNVQRSPSGKPDQAMYFDIELLGVSSDQAEAYKVKQTADSVAMAKSAKKK
jgi:FKBP-type peptidyl-prolyl cis-trans isomerase